MMTDKYSSSYDVRIVEQPSRRNIMDVRPIPESTGEKVNFWLESSPDFGKQFRDSYYLVKY